MTDKQITTKSQMIMRIAELSMKLQVKEQECEELKRQRQADKGLITSTGKMNYQLLQEYDKLKSENKHLNDLLNQALKDYDKAVQTLTEIKPILEFYANSKMGEEQPDRTYKIMLSGGYIMAYDPKPARQALQKISEVEDEN